MAAATVLCIDADAIFRETVKETLAEAGYGFIPASGGRDGLERFFAQRPQAVIVDMKTPDMGGLEVLATVVENAPEVPVIMVSGAGEMSDVISALRMGAWDFVVKSLRSISLLELHLERALDKARLKRENRIHREKLEAALYDKERYRKNLEIAFENMPDGIVTVDCEGALSEWNTTMAREFGDFCSLRQGLNFYQTFQSHMPECAEALAKALEKSEPSERKRVKWPHLGPDGLVAELTVVPYQDASSSKSGAILILRDMTRQAALESRLKNKHSLDGIIGKSPAMQQVFVLLRRMAGVDVSVLISGEHGTGKAIAAETLHFNSRRRGGPLVEVNCAALSEQLLESELFGHAKGAFPGADHHKAGLLEQANGGTIIIHCVQDLPLSLQARLMRFMETGTLERTGEAAPRASDVRVVACTSADLQHLAASGLFRDDLFYRLKVMHAHVPPLRQRREDIPLLVKHFIASYAKENGKRVTGASEPVLAVLLRHDWPGNVLELKHALEQACLLCEGEVLAVHDLPPDLAAPGLTPGIRADLGEYAILDALNQASGNKSRAAKLLGVNRKTLYRKMHKLGISGQTTTRRRKDT